MDGEIMVESPSTGKLRSVQAAADAVRRSWWIVLIPALVFGCVALGVSMTQTTIYRSSAVLYVTSGSDANALSAYQGSLASQQRVTSYVRLVRSDAVLRSALETSGLPLSMDDARDAVSASATPETVLLTISADDSDPTVATALANAVGTALSQYVETLEKPSGGGEPLAKVTLVTPASSDGVVAPLTGRNVGLGALFGLLIGLVLATVRHRLDNKIRNEADVESSSGSIVLAVVPADGSLSSGGSVDLAGGSGHASEAYRKLRTNLEFASVDAPARKILITSPSEGDGKTTTALSLGAVLAESGRRVVVVGADLRKPTIAERASVSPSIGLTSYLRGEVPILDVVQGTETENLYVLASGQIPPNPSELLGSLRAAEGFDELAAHFDTVLVDSAPMLPVSDASVVSKWMDGMILVVRAEKTRRAELEATVADLAMTQTRFLGVILNGVSEHRGPGSYSYYWYTSFASEDQRTGTPATS